MNKVESVLNDSLGWGKTRSLATFPQIRFGLLFLILHKIFTMKGSERCASASHPHIETLFKRPVSLNLTLPHLTGGGTYEFNGDHPMPGIEVPGKCWSCTTFFKIYNLSCKNFWKKNQPKNTTNGVLTNRSANAILENLAWVKNPGKENLVMCLKSGSRLRGYVAQ